MACPIISLAWRLYILAKRSKGQGPHDNKMERWACLSSYFSSLSILSWGPCLRNNYIVPCFLPVDSFFFYLMGNRKNEVIDREIGKQGWSLRDQDDNEKELGKTRNNHRRIYWDTDNQEFFGMDSWSKEVKISSPIKTKPKKKKRPRKWSLGHFSFSFWLGL